MENKNQINDEQVEQKAGALDHKQIQIVLHQSPEASAPKTVNGYQRTCFDVWLHRLGFMVKFGFFSALGLCGIVLANTQTCNGTPGLLTFLFGVGILMVWQAGMTILWACYFEDHNRDHSGRFFDLLTGLSQLCGLALCLYGLYELGCQTINEGVESGVIKNGSSSPGNADEIYGCSNTVYEVSFVTVIGILFWVASLIYRACNYYKMSSSSTASSNLPNR